MALKIYTKKGDYGSTALIGGTRVVKSDVRIEAYGTVDELNSFLGLLSAEVTLPIIQEEILQLQQHLFVIGSLLACSPSREKPDYIPSLDVAHISWLELCIDQMTEVLPHMTHFIIPGGSKSIALAHVCRSICRRAERNCVLLESSEGAEIGNNILSYLNRLSDYLFVLARYLGKEENVEEVKWIP